MAAAVAVATAALLGLWLLRLLPGGAEQEPVDATADVRRATEVTCDSVRTRQPERCGTIETGGSTYRYALVEPDGGASELMVVDPGGPGRSGLADGGFEAMLGALGGEPPPSTAQVMIEEPWVTRPSPTSECADAAEDYLAAFAADSGIDSAAQAITADCADSEYGWSRDRYRDVVEAIASEFEAPVTTFVGSSFAAHRLAWLTSDNRFDISTAALVNPFLPGLSLEQILNHQAAHIEQMLSQSSDAWASAEEPESMLVAAAASQLPQERADEPSRLNAEAEQVRQLAHDYIGRYGRDQLALSRLAYIQELCASGLGAPSASADEGGAALRVLAEAHSGCEETTSAPPLADRDVELCLVASEQDAVLPFEALQDSGSEIEAVTESSHIDVSGLAHCSDQIQGGASRD